MLDFSCTRREFGPLLLGQIAAALCCVQLAQAAEPQPDVPNRPVGTDTERVITSLESHLYAVYQEQDHRYEETGNFFTDSEAQIKGASIILNGYETLCEIGGSAVPSRRDASEEFHAINIFLARNGYTDFLMGRERTDRGIYLSASLRRIFPDELNLSLTEIVTPFLDNRYREGLVVRRSSPYILRPYFDWSEVLHTTVEIPGANIDDPYRLGKRCVVLCPEYIESQAFSGKTDPDYFHLFVLANEVGNFVFDALLSAKFPGLARTAIKLEIGLDREWNAKDVSEAYSDYVSLLNCPPQPFVSLRREPIMFYQHLLTTPEHQYPLSEYIVRVAFEKVHERHFGSSAVSDPKFSRLLEFWQASPDLSQEIYQTVLDEFAHTLEPVLRKLISN